ncbi:hypothetical protein ACFPRL_36410 [Pseudoclavibacter helvolus]
MHHGRRSANGVDEVQLASVQIGHDLTVLSCDTCGQFAVMLAFTGIDGRCEADSVVVGGLLPRRHLKGDDALRHELHS